MSNRDAFHDPLSTQEHLAGRVARGFDPGSAVTIGAVEHHGTGASVELTGIANGRRVEFAVFIPVGALGIEAWSVWEKMLKQDGLVVREDAVFRKRVCAQAE